jgi:membrane-bound lytic murein transglycosylase C
MRHKSPLLILSFIFLFTASCDKSTVRALSSAAVQGNLQNAASRIAQSKAKYYAANPKQALTDFKKAKKKIQEFFGLVETIWGNKEAKRPTAKRYVKYTHNYKSRAWVDFDKGLIRVETLDEKKPIKRLQEAIVTTLLTPDDPGAVDLFSDKPIALTGRPYLKGQVLDNHGQTVATIDAARRFAQYLTNYHLRKDTIHNSKKSLNRHFVNISMIPDHLDVRAARYKGLVKKHADNYAISTNLVFSIIKTESDFNPFAVSSVPAYGLMQIVPTTAGRDTYEYIHGRPGTPSRNYLFSADKNIRMGSAYLNLLGYKYLKGIQDQLTREYCMIAAYNGGIGRVLRLFSKNKKTAITRINTMKPNQVYSVLRKKMPLETQRYLKKVVDFKKGFVGI